jgi:hypothetical protein
MALIDAIGLLVGILRADHPALIFQWSVRAGMTCSRWFRREAIINNAPHVPQRLAPKWIEKRYTNLSARIPSYF